MLPIILHVHLSTQLLVRRLLRRAGADESGQTSAEYALVLLGAAAVALLVVLWAKNTGKVGDLLDEVLDDIVDTAT